MPRWNCAEWPCAAPGKDRGIPEELQTTDAESLVARDDVDLVVEVIGGMDLPRKLILSALNSGKSVVTANKALLADHTGELAEAAELHNVDLYFEAAVAGAIPRDPPAHPVPRR